MTTNLSNKIRSNIFLDDFLKNIPIVNKTSEELLRVESIELLSQTSFTCLINLLMYWFDDYHIAFVCGKKYTHNLLKKEWKRIFSIAIISSIAFRRNKRISVAIWSFLERPVCSFFPRSPVISIKRCSICM